MMKHLFMTKKQTNKQNQKQREMSSVMNDSKSSKN